MDEDELGRVIVVLVRARNPGNIGAVARAMHDFGFRHLRIVNDYPVPFREARAAVDASAVLEAALECATLAEAVGDCTLVVGTTAVGERVLAHALHPLPAAALLLHRQLAHPAGRVALVFGSEKTGLSNDELSHCHWLLTIPMHTPAAGERHVSMNLGQAAAVCLFELVRQKEGPPCPAPPQPANAAELELLTRLLGQVLERTGYSRRHPAHCDAASQRRLVHRLVAEATDAVVWMGILRQVLWALAGHAATPVADIDEQREPATGA